MCEICHQTPCASRCPNAVEEGIVCDVCGNLIHSGEAYYNYEEAGGRVCEDCMNNHQRFAEESILCDCCGETIECDDECYEFVYDGEKVCHCEGCVREEYHIYEQD